MCSCPILTGPIHFMAEVAGNISSTRPGYVNSLLLKMTIEIVDFPIDSMVIFYSFLYVYQMVKHLIKHDG